MCDTTPDGAVVNMFLPNINIWLICPKNLPVIENIQKSDQIVFFHKFRYFLSIFDEFLMLFQIFFSIFSTSVSFRQLPPASASPLLGF